MHTSKPAQGKVVDSCQFHGVWRCLMQLGSSSVKTAVLALPAPSPGPWAPSPSQRVSRRVARFHLTMEMGLPSLPASFWADLKVCIPGLENLPYPKSRLKPTAAFQALPGKPATDTHAHAHNLTSKVLGAVQLYEDNFTHSAYKLYHSIPSIRGSCVQYVNKLPQTNKSRWNTVALQWNLSQTFLYCFLSASCTKLALLVFK